MSKTKTIKYTKDTEWLDDAIEKERIKQNRPSANNTILNILVDYFKTKTENK